MRRLAVVLLLVMLLVSLVPTTRAADPAPELPGNFMGMVVRDPHYEWKTNPAFTGTNRAFFDAMGQHLEAAGVKWVRIEFFADAALEQGSIDYRGRVNIEKYRYFIEVVAPRHGIKVLALLATPLARQRPAGVTPRFPDDVYGPGEYISPERIEDPLDINAGVYGFVNPYMHIWLENAFTIARNFPYDAVTGRGIAAYEVLNEQNRYLNGNGKGMRPDMVATMLTKFYRVFKKNGGPDGSFGAWRNDVKILIGGLHPERCEDCIKSDGTARMTDRQYLDAIYKSSAFQRYRNDPALGNGKYPHDGVGYHPYAAEMRSGAVPEDTAVNDLFRVQPRMQAMRNVMLQNGDAANKFWITEVGDRGAPMTVDPVGDNERRQAQFMRTVYWTLWQDREFIENVFWFKYEDFAVPTKAGAVGTENWGVVRLQPGTTTEYDINGTVQRFKESYRTYQNIAQNGLQTYTTHLPLVANNP